MECVYVCEAALSPFSQWLSSLAALLTCTGLSILLLRRTAVLLGITCIEIAYIKSTHKSLNDLLWVSIAFLICQPLLFLCAKVLLLPGHSEHVSSMFRALVPLKGALDLWPLTMCRLTCCPPITFSSCLNNLVTHVRLVSKQRAFLFNSILF